jgi:Ca2+-binding EF-hand superfamily protein
LQLVARLSPPVQRSAIIRAFIEKRANGGNIMKTILAGAALLLAATAASAQVAPYAQDGAREGVQTRSEAVERARTMFARVDANRDGFITMEEGRALRAQAGQRRGGQRVARGGQAGRGQMFERLDTNRDNVISRDEFARAQELRGQRAGAREQRMAQRTAMRGRMGGAMLRAADANRDQRISLAEAETAALRRFDRVDLNRDGQVTRDERQQLRQQRGQARPAVQPVR